MVKGSHGLDIVSDLKANDGTLLMASKPGEVILSDLIVVNNGTHEAELLNCEKMKRLKVFTLNDSKKVTDGSGRVKLKPGQYLLFFLRKLKILLFGEDSWMTNFAFLLVYCGC